MQNQMTKINLFRKNKLLVVLVAVLLAYLFVIISAGQKSDININSRVIFLEKGYGYEIVINGKVFIHQEYMPCISGYKLFESKNTAQIVADMVVEKLKNNESPTVSYEELKKAGVIQN